jgi:diguanylate cyclase
MKLLIVDDEPANLRLLRAQLESEGHGVVEAATGVEALRALEREPVEGIISDILMPEMDGFRLCLEVRKSEGHRTLPFVLYTSTYDSAGDRNLANSVGADSYIIKPSPVGSILEALRSARWKPRAQTAPTPPAVDELHVLKQYSETLVNKLAEKAEELQIANQRLERHAAELQLEITERKRAAEELRGSELRFRQLAENVREAFFLLDAKSGEMLYVSPAYESIWGRSCASLYADPRSWMNLVHPDDQDAVRSREALLFTTGHFDAQYRIVRRDKSARWVWMRIFPIHDEAHAIYRFAGIAEDITGRMEREQKIARLTRIYAVLSAINSAIVRIHDRSLLFREACRITVNEGAFQSAWIAEIKPDTREGQIVAWSGSEADLIDPMAFSTRADAPGGHWPASRAVRGMKPFVHNDIGSEPALAALGSDLLARGCRSVAAFPLIVEGRAAAVLVLYAGDVGFFDDQELRLLDGLAGDIAFALEYIEKEAKLNYLAYYDVLTGLPNSTLFRDRLAQFLDGSKVDGRAVALFMIDLDRFTHLNDTYGRRAGDTLLKMVAECLESSVPKPSSLARISADTFALAVAELESGADDVAAILERHIFTPLCGGFTIDGNEVRVSARAGIALFPGDGEDADALFTNAEAALKMAKTSGDAFVFYASEMNARIGERLALEGQLRKAQQDNQLVLHYQPKVELSTGQIIGSEALIRWQHPDLGLLYPGRFIAVAEESDQTIAIGEWVLRTACAQTKAWYDAGLPAVTVSVNLSARQFRDDGLVHRIASALQFTGLEARMLELELTENIVMNDPEQFIGKLKALKELGVKLSLDDFGTGYSSLTYLKRFPLDLLKIDQSFIRDVTTNPDDAAIVRAIISMGHSLGFDLVAEGVETAAQLAWLRRERCDLVQGYHFSRPVPAPDFEQMLRERKRLPSSAAGDGASAKTLLIVDDETNVIASLVRLLRNDGYRILTAHNAQQAFDILALDAVHVIISDHRMPVMTGAEFLGKVKTLYPDTVRILFSGYVEIDALTDAVNRGAVFRFLLKPWNDDMLRESIREAFHYHWLTHRGAAVDGSATDYPDSRSGELDISP